MSSVISRNRQFGFGEHAQRQRGDVVPLGTRRIFFFPPSSPLLPSRAPRAKWISFLFHIIVLKQLEDSDTAAPRVFSQVFKFTCSVLFPTPDATTCVCSA